MPAARAAAPPPSDAPGLSDAPASALPEPALEPEAPGQEAADADPSEGAGDATSATVEADAPPGPELAGEASPSDAPLPPEPSGEPAPAAEALAPELATAGAAPHDEDLDVGPPSDAPERRAAAAADSAFKQLVAGGVPEAQARLLLSRKLQPIGWRLHERVHCNGELYTRAAEDFERDVGAALAEILSSSGLGSPPVPDPDPGAALPAPTKPTIPPVPPHHVRRRTVGQVSAHGYTLDGHRREHWASGEVGDFKQHVVDSAPHAFTKP